MNKFFTGLSVCLLAFGLAGCSVGSSGVVGNPSDPLHDYVPEPEPELVEGDSFVKEVRNKAEIDNLWETSVFTASGGSSNVSVPAPPQWFDPVAQPGGEYGIQVREKDYPSELLEAYLDGLRADSSLEEFEIEMTEENMHVPEDQIDFDVWSFDAKGYVIQVYVFPDRGPEDINSRVTLFVLLVK